MPIPNGAGGPERIENVPKVELFGTLRIYAGQPEVAVDATTIRDALMEVEAKVPSLTGRILDGPRLSTAYRLSVNADRFVSDLGLELLPTDSLLVISADPGG